MTTLIAILTTVTLLRIVSVTTGSLDTVRDMPEAIKKSTDLNRLVKTCVYGVLLIYIIVLAGLLFLAYELESRAILPFFAISVCVAIGLLYNALLIAIAMPLIGWSRRHILKRAQPIIAQEEMEIQRRVAEAQAQAKERE